MSPYFCRSLGNSSATTLTGTRFDDQLIAGNFGDRLLGNAGNDLLIGGDGADTIYGGTGDDILIGGRGNDFMVGGAGADRYIMIDDDRNHNGNGFNNGQDVISGFQHGIDKIVIPGSAVGNIPGNVMDYSLLVSGNDMLVLLRNTDPFGQQLFGLVPTFGDGGTIRILGGNLPGNVFTAADIQTGSQIYLGGGWVGT